MRDIKPSEHLKGTLKELESAFQEWDQVVATIEEPQDQQNNLLIEKTKTILDKLKNQIEELSE